MANKYSRSNLNSKDKKEEKTMQDYERKRQNLNKGARVIAIIMIAAMLIFTVITTGLFVLD